MLPSADVSSSVRSIRAAGAVETSSVAPSARLTFTQRSGSRVSPAIVEPKVAAAALPFTYSRGCSVSPCRMRALHASAGAGTAPCHFV